MKHKRKIFLFILLTTILLGSCAPQVEAAPTIDVNALMTQSVGTFSAQFFLTQTALVPPATPTPLNTSTSIATNTPLPLLLPSATYVLSTAIVYPTVTTTGTQYTPTTNPSTLATGCYNLSLIRDDSIPAGTVMAPGENFTKSWKVANNGTCTWNWANNLVFVSGDRMGGESSQPRNQIEAGKWTTLSIALTAPSAPGTYTGTWRLSDPQGRAFGSTLTVSIVVRRPPDTAVPPTSYP